jgi:hypothetical protein
MTKEETKMESPLKQKGRKTETGLKSKKNKGNRVINT